MRIGTRTRVGLFVSLGILAGIGFVGLPGLLLGSPHTIVTPKSNGSNSTSTSGSVTAIGSTTPTFNTRGNETQTQTPAGDQPVSIGSLAGLVSLVILPATAISVVGSLLVAKRSRKSSPRIQSDLA